MIRPMVRDDLNGAKTVIEDTGLFPPEMLDDMAATALNDPSSRAFWLVSEVGTITAIAFVAPEEMANRVWNILLIAVAPNKKRTGTGRAMMAAIKDRLAERDARLVLVETSGLPEFDIPRLFYRSEGFEEEGRIRDYYADGEDKVVFRKRL